MQVEQVDLHAACDFADWRDNPRQLTQEDVYRLAGEFARHREVARIEGIRLGLEAAAGVCDEHGVTWGLSYRSMTDVIATAIRAIDPTSIKPSPKHHPSQAKAP